MPTLQIIATDESINDEDTGSACVVMENFDQIALPGLIEDLDLIEMLKQTDCPDTTVISKPDDADSTATDITKDNPIQSEAHISTDEYNLPVEPEQIETLISQVDSDLTVLLETDGEPNSMETPEQRFILDLMAAPELNQPAAAMITPLFAEGELDEDTRLLPFISGYSYPSQGILGQPLYEIELTLHNESGTPGTLTWVNRNMTLSLGNNTYEAIFTPFDLETYKPVIIEIEIFVDPDTRLWPNISLERIVAVYYGLT